jgi:uncharacterized protein YndB with AHSA1/START domain
VVERANRRLTVTTPSNREVLLTRVFDAPRRLVFEAFTKPEHVARWYGCRGYTCPVCEIDLRVGGSYRYVARDPDGEEFGVRGTYREIAPPERLVCTERFDAYPDSEAVITMTLHEHEGKTMFSATIAYESAAVRDAVIASGMERGAGETYDRLAELLAHLSQTGASA